MHSMISFASSLLLLLLLSPVLVEGLTNFNRGLAVEDDDVSSAEWTYRATTTSGEEPYGPSDWYLGYADCGLNSQSPINLAAGLYSDFKSPSDYTLEFTPNVCDSSELTFQADYAVWKVSFDQCQEAPYLKWQGSTFDLIQIHIHSPSEHLVGGAEHDAEIHMVHLKEGTTSELLVVGVLFDVSEYGSNVKLQDMWDVLGVGATNTTESITTSAYDLLPSSPTFSHYMGSLTTPPCTEGVTWVVMDKSSFMSVRQLEEYRRSVALFSGSKVDEFGSTNRPAQPLNGRSLVYVTP